MTNPVYRKVSEAVSNFSYASAKNIADMPQLHQLVDAHAAAKTLHSTPVLNTSGSTAIGFDFVLTPEQETTNLICINRNKIVAAHDSNLKLQLETAVANNQVDQFFLENAVEVILDGPSVMYSTDSEQLIDITSGMGPQAARLLLRNSLIDQARFVSGAVKVEITDNQFIALVSLCLQIGAEEFTSSNLVQELNQDNAAMVPTLMQQWRASADASGRIVVRRDLVDRRIFEAGIFSTPDLLSISPDTASMTYLEQAVGLESKQAGWIRGEQ
jgi:GH24 family phage-related lysozyme (muramidase)